jgi:hypothetical protein
MNEPFNYTAWLDEERRRAEAAWNKNNPTVLPPSEGLMLSAAGVQAIEDAASDGAEARADRAEARADRAEARAERAEARAERAEHRADQLQARIHHLMAERQTGAR